MFRLRATWACGSLIGALLLTSCAASRGGRGSLGLPEGGSACVSRVAAPRRIALVVGIQRFDDPRWRPLRFPVSDAEEVAKILRDPWRGRFDQVQVISPGATREQLRGALQGLAAQNTDEQDTVVVYVSTHGTLARDERGELRRYLVARDTRVDAVAATGLTLAELKGEFARLRSRRKVLILAACHSGSGESSLQGTPGADLAASTDESLVRPAEEPTRSGVVIAASSWGETAREDARLGHDIYTHFLVEALRLGADRNGDGAVSVSEAHDYARRMTYDYTGGRQRPTAETDEVGGDPVFLAGALSGLGRPELYSYAARLHGFTVRVDGMARAALPGGVALDPGAYRVQIAKGGDGPLLDTRLTLAPGERVDVATLVPRWAGRLEVAPRVARLSFLDRRSREDVLGPVNGVGATVSVREWPAPGMEVRADAITSAGHSRLTVSGGPLEMAYDLLSVGVTLPWRFRPAVLARTEFFAGPRFSALFVRRRFDLSPSPGMTQLWFSFLPGFAGGVDIRLTRRLSLAAETHVDWMLTRIDGADRSSFVFEGLAGLGWRF